MTPQNEAARILNEVISNLTSTTKNLIFILRKCYLVCELLRWEKQRIWFHNELNGYSNDASIPAYRQIPGEKIWEPMGSINEKAKIEAGNIVYGKDPNIFVVEKDMFIFRGQIDWLINMAQYGYRESANTTKKVYIPHAGQNITLQQIRNFPPSSFAHSIFVIEQRIFAFATNAYAHLKYGSAISDIWSEYRQRVETALINIEMKNHLDAIQNGLRSDNPEEWRGALWKCRDLLKDVADYLWRDPRDYYEKSSNEKLDVGKDRYINRLLAYIHQKGIKGKRGEFICDEIKRLGISIRSLNSLTNKAHDPVKLDDVRSAALGIYFIIGEIAIKTDFLPIERYENLNQTE